jgi:hypothetical protein
MNALPFLKKVVATLSNFGNEPPKVGTLDADAGNDLWIAASAQQVDFRLPWPGDVNMHRFVIGRVNDKPEAVGAVNDNHASR